MTTRIISSIVGLPILIFLICYGGIGLKIALIIVSIIGMSESYKAISKQLICVHYIAFFYAIIYILFLEQTSSTFHLVFNSLFIISVLIMTVFNHTKVNVTDVSQTFFGFYYVAYLMAYIYLVRESYLGEYFVWLIFISAWACDTGAYFVGVTMGKRKLTPVLSPNKTIEGAIGGVIVAAFTACIYGYIVSRFLNSYAQDVRIVLFSTIIGGVGAVFAQLGDLTASAIKRYTKIKDYGNIIPGHGGIIDRFDSVLFTAPIVFIVTKILFM